jgi:hypothetical protein
VYNNEQNPVDLAGVTVSIKGGTPVALVSIQGGTVLQPNTYAIISSIVSASQPVSKFLDTSVGYPSYTGILMRTVSSISLVNTGATSLDVRLQGSVVDTLASYTPAGEGKTLSKINGSFVSGTPTPGADNQAFQETNTQSTINDTQTSNQTTITPLAPPSPDIILYLPKERLIVAGAETPFAVYGMTRSGKTIENIKATWAFGDGGQGVGTSTKYTYAYPGRYIARVEAGDGYVMGVGTTQVTVVLPELSITRFSNGKYGSFIDISNPNTYDLDVSQWNLHIGDTIFPFPKNTILAKQSVTHITGKAMGFASTTEQDVHVIRITFPNQEEVTRFSKDVVSETNTPQLVTSFSNSVTHQLSATTTRTHVVYTKETTRISSPQAQVVPTQTHATTSRSSGYKKDTRLVAFFRSWFSR